MVTPATAPLIGSLDSDTQVPEIDFILADSLGLQSDRRIPPGVWSMSPGQQRYNVHGSHLGQNVLPHLLGVRPLVSRNFCPAGLQNSLFPWCSDFCNRSAPYLISS